MTAEQLRHSLLQEAISGRLVPQDPNDEPASVLLDKIRDEKARLIKEGKLKKEKPSAPITDDEKPFEIPASWEWCRIKDVFSMHAGKFISANNIFPDCTDEHQYPCYGGNGLRGYVKEYNTEGYCILVGRQGALCGNVNIANGKFYATEHAVITDGFGITDVLWAYYFLKALNLNQYATATAQPGLAVSNVVETLIPFPPLAEQQRIVAKLEELLPIVEQYGKAQTELDELNAALPTRLRQSILQQAISGRLVPQDPNDEPASMILKRTMEEREKLLASKEIRKDDLKVSPLGEDLPYELPSGWVWVTIDRIAIVKGGKRIPVGKTFSAGPTPYMYIRVTEMKNNTLIDCEHKYISAELRESLKRYIIHSTDIYVTIAGTIGAVGDVPEKFNGMNLTENALKLSHLHVNKKYLIYALSSPLVQDQFKEKTNKVGQPKLAMERVKSTLFPLPPLAEQQRIVAKIEELFAEIDKMK